MTKITTPAADVAQAAAQATTIAQESATVHPASANHGSVVNMPTNGKTLLLQADGSGTLIDKATLDLALTDGLKAYNSRWSKPLFRYGLMTAVSLLTGGLGYAGGTYVANRKHDAWVDAQVADGKLQTEGSMN